MIFAAHLELVMTHILHRKKIIEVGAENLCISSRVPHKIQSENFETGHLFSIAKLNFESICFLAFLYLRPFKLVHRHLKFLAFLHSENEVKICKIDKMAKNHFSRAEKGSQGV